MCRGRLKVMVARGPSFESVGGPAGGSGWGSVWTAALIMSLRCRPLVPGRRARGKVAGAGRPPGASSRPNRRRGGAVGRPAATRRHFRGRPAGGLPDRARADPDSGEGGPDRGPGRHRPAPHPDLLLREPPPGARLGGRRSRGRRLRAAPGRRLYRAVVQRGGAEAGTRVPRPAASLWLHLGLRLGRLLAQEPQSRPRREPGGHAQADRGASGGEGAGYADRCMAAFGCNYQGDITPDQVVRTVADGLAVAEEKDVRISDVTLAD